MADPANALTTTARVKQLLAITASTYDSQIEGVIGAVSQAIETYCGRKFRYASAYTEYHDITWDDTRDVYVKNPPLVAVTSVHESAAQTYDATSLLTAGTDYLAYTESGNAGKIRRFGGGWATGDKVLQIIYTGGYNLQANVPTDLAEIAAHICVLWWKMAAPSKSQRMGIVSHSADGVNVGGYLQDLPPYQRATLDRYRIGRVG